MNRILPNRRGASPKNLLIVLGVGAGLLLLLVVGAAGFFTAKQRVKAQVQASQLKLQHIANLLHQYELNQEPSALPDTLNLLVHPPGGQPGLARPDDLLDSWGNPIRYERAGKTFTLTSLGPDAILGTDDDLILKE